MTDRPIIFCAPMIQALLAGRKTQTRRLAWSKRKPTSSNRGTRLSRWDGRSIWQTVRPGDRLWVRESWALAGCQADATGKEYFDARSMLADHLRFRADAQGYDEVVQEWRSTIHMPRWASRLTLLVTATKVERLQAIELPDVRAEGCEVREFWIFGADKDGRNESARNIYRGIWESLHGAGAWDANPEVVVLAFTVKQRNIDHVLAA